MGFQKCPSCNGTGVGERKNFNTPNVCPACKGCKIISKLPGTPPSNLDASIPNKAFRVVMKGNFNDLK